MIKKQEKKLRFNIVDALVLLVAILCIATVVNRAMVINDRYTDIEYSEYTVKFSIENTDNDVMFATMIASIKSGDNVNKLSEEEQKSPVENENDIVLYSLGKIDGALTFDDEKNSAIGFITVKGIMTVKGIELPNGEYIVAESSHKIGTPTAKGTITILELFEK